MNRSLNVYFVFFSSFIASQTTYLAPTRASKKTDKSCCKYRTFFLFVHYNLNHPIQQRFCLSVSVSLFCVCRFVSFSKIVSNSLSAFQRLTLAFAHKWVCVCVCVCGVFRPDSLRFSLFFAHSHQANRSWTRTRTTKKHRPKILDKSISIGTILLKKAFPLLCVCGKL